jgi:hypothetical protein
MGAGFLRCVARVERDRNTRSYGDADEQFDGKPVDATIQEFAEGRLRHVQMLRKHRLRDGPLTDRTRQLQSKGTAQAMNCDFFGQRHGGLHEISRRFPEAPCVIISN